jgi:hypothetical protein
MPLKPTMRILLLSLLFQLSYNFLFSQTNSFPLYSYGAFSGGVAGTDYTNITNAQLKLQASTGFIRMTHLSADPNVSTVYNYENGKNIYWGETSDVGNYIFNGRNLMVMTGKVGIGVQTANTLGYALAVNGSAIFTKAVVKPYLNWPDYVFKTDYPLPSLASVAKYIQANNHLPEMPSADSVEKQGIDLGANQTLLLKKIEELTLYLIQQNKELEKLKQHDQKLQEQNKELKMQQERLDRLERLIEQKRKN